MVNPNNALNNSTFKKLSASRQIFLFLFSYIFHNVLLAGTITASMGNVNVSFELTKNGAPLYTVSFNKRIVMKPSSMGFIFSDKDNFYSGFIVLGSEKKEVDETWKPVWGEVNEIRNHYEQLTIHLKQSSGSRLLDVAFRVFADGVGFRYEFPKQPFIKYFIVTDELTQFHLAGNHNAFWIPGDYDTNEYPYTRSKISEIDNKDMVEKSTAIAVRVAPDRYAVQTPLMMKSNDGLYINIHEAALVDYPAMQLHVDTATTILPAALCLMR